MGRARKLARLGVDIAGLAACFTVLAPGVASANGQYVDNIVVYAHLTGVLAG
jgi:hypothetical protein